MRHLVVKILGVLFFLLMVVGSVSAEEKKTTHVKIDERDVSPIIVKVPRPDVWYLLPRAKLRFEQGKMDRKLAPKVIQATEQAPF